MVDANRMILKLIRYGTAGGTDEFAITLSPTSELTLQCRLLDDDDDGLCEGLHKTCQSTSTVHISRRVQPRTSDSIYEDGCPEHCTTQGPHYDPSHHDRGSSVQSR